MWLCYHANSQSILHKSLYLSDYSHCNVSLKTGFKLEEPGHWQRAVEMQARGTYKEKSSQQRPSSPVQCWPCAAVPVMRATFCRSGCSNTNVFQQLCQCGQSQGSVR